MIVTPTNSIFAEFTTAPTSKTVSPPLDRPKEKEIDRKLLLTMIALGTLGVATIGIGIIKKKYANKKMFSLPETDLKKLKPETIKIKPEDYIVKPKKHQPKRVLKVATAEEGRQLKIQEYRTGSLSECFDDSGKFLYRERNQTIERPDGFSDKLQIMTLDDGQTKKTFGRVKVFCGYDEEEIGITKEFVKNKKGKWALRRRDATFTDNMHSNVKKIVEHLQDGTTEVTLIKESFNTKEIKVYDRKGNILSQSTGFL